jgi:thioredoxin 1
MSEVTFTDANFEAEVLQSKGLVMVDFFAPWCGPCKMMAPSIEKLAVEYKGKAKIGKLNVDDNQAVATKYQIQSIPTIIIFKDGEMVDSMMGMQSEAALKQKLDSL